METTFADRLRSSMESNGFKQIDLIRLAEERGQKLGKSQISQYLSGKTEPRPGIMELLADILSVSEDWLAGDGYGSSSYASSSSLSYATPSMGSAGDDASQTDSVTGSQEGATSKSSPSPAPRPQAPRRSRSRRASRQPEMENGVRMFTKSHKLDNVLYDVRGPVLDEANRMEDQGVHVLKLNIGNPAPFGFRTPDEVVKDMQDQLRDCEGYSDSRGLFSARKAIMQYDQLKGIPNVDVEDIYTGNGASELINLAMSAFLDDGDEILIPSPDYPLWTASATLAGGRVIHYVCDEQANWYPDIDDIRSKITPRTKGIVIINPNNPTGALYPKEVLEEIVQVAREHQLVIFSDEIYDRLVMDGKEHVSIASLAPDLFCITFNGLSKSHMIAGYRIGWMSLSGNKRIARDLIDGINMLSNMRLCSNVPAQSVVQTCLGGIQRAKNYLVPGGRIYDQREYVYDRLSQMEGVTVNKPDAAFYMFPRLDPQKFNIRDDDQFALDLLKEKHVLIVGGKGFNWMTPGYFRVVYLPRMHTLEDAMDNLEDFLRYYRQ
ncbi:MULTISPECIES: aminotransferase class I/II-fold pyridoxal phosphate-dependent enzyme [Atopobiaceae]|uniref:alanine transaminase n=1 Tax=Parafannyhessea umbonata TaxID=604330 RepID=A0A1H6HPY3_9ACTN|nr:MULTISPECIES: aminotransferase class I/II-fold pyridoxal phosphate-dependent enzyme [Atopobiaceae]SEH36238.1 alanine-synthesizing transaminase [Parafannyhessea umbonata]SJZ37404.1 alanine-synthesizing transaminase [Olsenella sp. KH1P3]